MKFLSSYFDSEWSFAQYKVVDSKTKIAFGKEDNSLFIVGYSGSFYTVQYDSNNGGECFKTFQGKIFQDATTLWLHCLVDT